jgi:hypothetical protein
MPIVDRLLTQKASSAETTTAPRIEALNDWIDSSISELESKLVTLPTEQKPEWSKLNRLFSAIVESRSPSAVLHSNFLLHIYNSS